MCSILWRLRKLNLFDQYLDITWTIRFDEPKYVINPTKTYASCTARCLIFIHLRDRLYRPRSVVKIIWRHNGAVQRSDVDDLTIRSRTAETNELGDEVREIVAETGGLNLNDFELHSARSKDSNHNFLFVQLRSMAKWQGQLTRMRGERALRSLRRRDGATIVILLIHDSRCNDWAILDRL